MGEKTTSRRLYLTSVAGVFASAGCLGENGGTSAPSTPAEQRGTEAIVPVMPVDSLPTPIQGDPDADVSVSVYEDFACPHCRDYTVSVLPEVVDEFIDPGKIRYERHDFPIPVDERWSWAAANAARSVQANVDIDAFWQYSDLLYEKQGGYSYKLFAELAERVDAPPETVQTAAEEGVYRKVLEKNRQQGRERGVTGTPTVFVNGLNVDPSYEKIRRAIRNQLDSSG